MIATFVHGRLHYAWLVVAVTFATMLVAAVIRSMPGILILPLEGEFGWNRAAISLAISVNLLLYGFCGPFAAAVVERVGLPRLMAGALLTIAVAVVLTTQMRAVWQLQLLWGLVLGVGAGAMAGWMAASVSNRWFVERRGLVVGVLGTSTATGQLLFLPLLASLTQAFGWRTAVLFAAGVVLLVIPLVLLVVRDYPQDVGLRPYGAGPDADPKPTPRSELSNPFTTAVGTLRRALRHRDFLLLAGSFSICGASANGLIGTHLIPASVEHGMSNVAAASFLASMGIFNIAGAMASGWLSDRFDSRWLLAWYYGLRGLSLLFLPYALEGGVLSLAVFIVFYGLDWSATMPATVRLTADIFGKRDAAAVYAWIFASHQIGAATVATTAGALRTWLGDYHASFMISGALCLFGVYLVLQIARPVRPEPAPSLRRA